MPSGDEMRNSVILLFIMLVFFSVSSIADNDSTKKPISHYTYKECLRDSIQKNNNLSADDIRSLCKEITARPEPSYEWNNGDLIPSDDFTRCYDKTRKEEIKKGTKDADEIAKLLCHYAPK
jgi:hypothetical protein